MQGAPPPGFFITKGALQGAPKLHVFMLRFRSLEKDDDDIEIPGLNPSSIQELMQDIQKGAVKYKVLGSLLESTTLYFGPFLAAFCIALIRN